MKNSKTTHHKSKNITAPTTPVTKGAAKPQVKTLHPRSKHNQGYDFEGLIAKCPKLSHFVRPNPYGNLSIDFSDPEAVKSLNAAILKTDYQIEQWNIPTGFLCPPVPGRVDYIHYIADLLSVNNKVPKGVKVRALDIGTGANGIYPLLGAKAYGWRFVATDIDPVSIANVADIITHNPDLSSKIELRHQTNATAIFSGIIGSNERFDFTMCNPPFHRSLEDASKGSAKKNANLAANRAKKHADKQAATKSAASLNFGGQKAELWCEGGEQQFLENMINESQHFSQQCLWFTSLVSKSENLKPCYKLLKQLNVDCVKTIEMQQGNKFTRVLAWSYLPETTRIQWAKFRNNA
ncbi:23S rRNA (adenine(1618)-N(6))-methyltransferase RlmF [Shewanella donghaensis]|uniref:23S rRNA (adenine(1618)-N(6))-methyltransferase RlmF n=1 Tax=Shewanella donghaensis TaxID=238836 RepID=UPI0011839A21|nr:23S rRNA (adenine(1618)-N(6))-methyltransferase RlmF [Shewanella donghaensis]